MSRPIGSRKYKVDDNFFDTPNILNSYWAGFLAADGSLTCNRNNIKLNISTKDEKHLRKYKRDLKFNGPMRYSRELCIIEIYSQRLRNNIKKYFNITKQKSLTLKPPNIYKRDHIFAFIIGYIDGDGWRTNSRSTPCIGFQGTEKIVNWICNFLNKEYPAIRAQTKARKILNKNCWQATIYGERVRNLTKTVRSFNIPFLERKWQ